MKMTCVSAAVLMALLAAPAGTQTRAFKIVVNANNPLSSATPDDVSKYFLKTKTTWPDGSAVHPLDLGVSSAVREDFSMAVHKRKALMVQHLWRSRVFVGGLTPPPEAPSEAYVLAFVGENRGGIAYVSSSAKLSPALKVVEVR